MNNAPFGEIISNYNPMSWQNGIVPEYMFTAKELDEENGMYYYEARYLPPGRPFISRDPHFEKYFWLSPYNYCANNPVKYIDPTGMEVEAVDEQSKSNIKNTLTKQEARFVRYDRNGVLNSKRLNKSKSTSENMTALKALANSETKYKFSVAEKSLTGESFYNKGGNPEYPDDFYNGVTMMPGAEHDPSPNNDVHIITSAYLNEGKQVENVAHEAYGHAYYYELKQQGHDVEPNHTYGKRPDGSFYRSNTPLENQIMKVVNQAKTNYQSRKK